MPDFAYRHLPVDGQGGGIPADGSHLCGPRNAKEQFGPVDSSGFVDQDTRGEVIMQMVDPRTVWASL